MEKTKIRPIPKNVPHASGMFLAKASIRTTTIFIFIVLAVVVTFFKNDTQLASTICKLALVLVPLIAVIEYISGKRDQEEIRKYLNRLREDYSKLITSVEVEKEIQNQVNQEMYILKERLKSFFKQPLAEFAFLKTTEKDAWVQFRKAMNLFKIALKKTGIRSTRKTGEDLEAKLFETMYHAVSDKKPFTFDLNWIEKIDLVDECKVITKRISQEVYDERYKLWRGLEKIDAHIANYSEVKK